MGELNINIKGRNLGNIISDLDYFSLQTFNNTAIIEIQNEQLLNAEVIALKNTFELMTTPSDPIEFYNKF